MTKNGKRRLANVVWLACAMAAVSQAGAEQLHGRIAAKTGTQRARSWTFEVSGDGLTAVDDVRVESIRLTQDGPAQGACHPRMQEPAALPLALGQLAPGGTLRGTVQFDFTGCANQAKFRVEVVLRGSGAARGVIRRNNDYR